MSNAMVSMGDMQSMAKALVSSKLFGFKTVEEAMSIMFIAQAEGRSPALAARDYHIIQGRPALKADAMLARFQQEGGIVEWAEYTDTKVAGKFSHPKSCPVPVRIEWTLDMAKRIGLANRDNWRNYPRAMLRSRVISEGVRTTYPGIAVGIYTVEEMQDIAKEKDITPTAGAGESLSEEQRVRVSDIADRVREWMNQGSLTDAFAELDNAALEVEEEVYLWTHFDSRVRRQLKEEGERERVRNAKAIGSNLISDAQHKRLEARIKELGLDREYVKQHVADTFGLKHFTELTREQYEALDTALDTLPLDRKATAPAGHPPVPASKEVPAAVAPINEAGGEVARPVARDTGPEPRRAANAPDPGVGTETAGSIPVPASPSIALPDDGSGGPGVRAGTPAGAITEDQALALENALDAGGKTLHNRFKAKMAASGWKAIAEIPESKFRGCMDWISAQVDRQNAETQS